jgi:thiosulfate dehydrogenase [quinone] large subunit
MALLHAASEAALFSLPFSVETATQYSPLLTRARPCASMKFAHQLVQLDGRVMFVAFVESIKYVGHMFPIAFLRIFLGYYYFNQALLNLQGDFLTHAYLAEDIRYFLPRNLAPEWYKVFLENVAIPNWQVFALTIIVAQFLIGVSYLIGYFVRPMSLLAILLSMVLMFSIEPHMSELQSTFTLILHVTLGWVGAGRCLGFDYFFYKRRRGIWW